MKKLLLVPLAALFLALPANAGSIHTLTLQQPQGSDQNLNDLIEVQSHRSVASVIATDALFGITNMLGPPQGLLMGMLLQAGLLTERARMTHVLASTPRSVART